MIAPFRAALPLASTPILSANVASACCPQVQAPSHPPVRLLTKVGADPHGRALLAELANDGVDTQYTSIAEAGEATPTSVILVCGSSRTIVHDPGLMVTAPMQPSEIDGHWDMVGSAHADCPKWLRGAALLLLDGRHPAAALHAAQCARAFDIPVLLDVERPRPGLRELLPLADYVVSSADYPAKIAAELVTESAARASSTGAATGDADAAKGAQGVARNGASGQAAIWLDEDASSEEMARFVLCHCPRAQWVILTLGECGAIAVERAPADGIGAVHKVPVWPAVQVKDTTGAGDAFVGATAACVRRGLALTQTLRLASYAAAANCAADGARGGMPQYATLPEELRSLLD